jgi:hypothetical protein
MKSYHKTRKPSLAARIRRLWARLKLSSNAIDSLLKGKGGGHE